MKITLLNSVVIILSLLAASASADEKIAPEPEIVQFAWTPPRAKPTPYLLDAPADQHQIVIYPGANKREKTPVIVAFHGQPKRNKPPRDYIFAPLVRPVVDDLVAKKAIPPVVLVMPVFRFGGQNWPDFDPAAFRKKVEKILINKKITPEYWLAFGHSGAAGCGGSGLNDIARMNPRAVGFFDTCLGRGWQNSVRALHKAKIETLNIHSVETAGFRPRQRPEYQHWFDFGKAYRPLGMRPTTCPEKVPGKSLRDQPYKCAATRDNTIQAFVVNSGEGVEAHRKILPIATRFFLLRHVQNR